MKKAFIILLIIIFSLLYYSGFLTKRETLPLSKDFFSAETSSSLDTTWSVKKKSPPDKKELDNLYQLKLDKGIRNLPIISFLLIRESERLMKKGDTEYAIELAQYSIKFSPDHFEPYFGLAHAYWHKSVLNFHLVIASIFQGLKKRVYYYPDSLKFFYNIFYILSNGILMTFIVLGIVILIKYIPLYFYDISKNLSKEISKLIINSFKIVVLLIPFFLRLDVLWAILFWTILLWGFITTKERRIIILFLIILVYVPFSLRSSSSFLNSQHSDIIFGINHANHEGLDGSIEKKLKNWLNVHPDDSEVLFSLGLMEKRRGNYSQAEDFYKKAIQYNPQMDIAYSNLGNIYLIQKLTDQAISFYQQAINLNPNKGAYYYNLYRAYSQETFISPKADKAFSRARELDPELVDFYSRIDSPNINRIIIDEILDSERLWDRLFNQLIGKEGILFWFFKAWFEKIPSRINFLIPILFLGFIIGLSRYIKTKKFLTRCPMCGSPTYRFYLGTLDDEFICFNCYRLFIQKEKLHPRIMEKKSEQVKDFQKQNKLVGKFISFFFSGFDYMWKGEFFKGLICVFVFFIFILRFIYWDGVISSSFLLPFPNLFMMILWVGLFIIFYLIIIWRILRPKSERPAK